MLGLINEFNMCKIQGQYLKSTLLLHVSNKQQEIEILKAVLL